MLPSHIVIPRPSAFATCRSVESVDDVRKNRSLTPPHRRRSSAFRSRFGILQTLESRVLKAGTRWSLDEVVGIVWWQHVRHLGDCHQERLSSRDYHHEFREDLCVSWLLVKDSR